MFELKKKMGEKGQENGDLGGMSTIRKKTQVIHSLKRKQSWALVVHARNPSTQKAGGLRVRGQSGMYSGTCLKKTKQNKKRAGGRAQTVEHLPSMRKALGSIPSTTMK
jgi:hypothetical protein